MSSGTTKTTQLRGANSLGLPANRAALITVGIPILIAPYAIWLLPRLASPVLQLTMLVVMYFVTMLGAEVGNHRYFAHQSFKTSRFVTLALGIAGAMSVQGPLLYWVEFHLRHHSTSDQPGDPHSPNLFGRGLLARLHGFYHSHMGWVFEGARLDSLRFTRKRLYDRDLMFLERNYLRFALLGLVLPAAAAAIATGEPVDAWQGLIVGGFFRVFLVQQFGFTIGSFTHIFGSRPHSTHDHSGNVWWLALPTVGSAWHNNHHAYSSSAITGLRWWQLDLGGMFIRLLEAVGLAWDVKRPSRSMTQ